MSGDIHSVLRERIISGELAPDSVLSQAEIAREFGLSRGPVREAFGRLQEEGLVTAELNRRPRVAGFDPASLDSLYGVRIQIEALGAQLTCASITQDQLDELHRLIDEMARAEAASHEWRRAHRAFHRTVVSGGGKIVEEQTLALAERSEPYLRLYIGNHRIGEADHEAVVAALEARDVETATRRHGQHVARTALSVLGSMAPEFEPRVIRSALQTFHLEEPAET